MKKFSIAACTASRVTLLALLLGALPLAPAMAQDAVPKPPSNCAFLPNAPDQHTVVKGDTLWDISAKFLQNPWCWPRVWGLNKDEIRNPHWIYPGQIVYFDRNSGKLRLGTPIPATTEPSTSEPAGTVKLSPQVRNELLSRQAIPTIRADRVGPFLVRPLIIEAKSFDSAPVIVAAPEGRVFLGRGDVAFVRGELKDGTSYQAFRPGQPLQDPDTGEVIAFEARFLGNLKLDRAGSDKDEAHRFLITDNREEMGVGDRLVATASAPVLNIAPHAPAQPLKGRVMSLYNDGGTAGQNDVVSINRGTQQGVDVGTVLEIFRPGKVIADRTNDRKPIRLPDEKTGTLLVFRVFQRVSYGLIMQSTDTVSAGDHLRSPD